ncbi:MAG: hypothetical protein ACE5GJ_09220 [Gemmatimonadota bacterium]
MSGDSRGYVTLACGRRRYLEMAVDMALSLREHSPLPVALVADETLGAYAREHYRGVFHSVAELPHRFRVERAAKYGVVEASPFEEGIFIDADCLIVSDPDGFWERLDGQGVALVGEMLGWEDDRTHHGFSTRTLMEEFGLERYLKSNSGVFYFRRSAALPIMEECLVCYREEVLVRLRGWLLGDELAFGVVGGRRGLGLFPLPGPMYWRPELAAMVPGRFPKPVCHMIGPVARGALKFLLQEVDRRRKEAGLPAGSARYWKREQRKVKWGRWFDALMAPLLPAAVLLGLQRPRTEPRTGG